MEDTEEILIKQELVNNEDILLNEREFKLEEDVPEYVNINLFSDMENGVKKSGYASFKCDYCPQTYRLLECIKIHSAYHNVTNVCPLCNKSFVYKTLFRSHLKQHIKEVNEREKHKTYSCAYCPKTFATNKPLVIHTRVHTNERPYKCEICGEAFKQSGPLKSHYVTHTKVKPFVCEICNGSYTTASSLKRHKRRIHDTGKVLKCTICDAKMYNLADFKAHKSTAHLFKGYSRKCTLCPEILYSRYSFNVHQRLQHTQHFKGSKSTVAIQCNFCDEVFSAKAAHMKHRLMHIGYTEEEMAAATSANLYKCKVCFRIFKKRSILFRHMEYHTGKRFPCKICGKYYRYYSLTQHIRKEHKLKCHLCYEGFKNRKSLSNHYMNCPALKSQRNKYRCNICREEYSMKYKLNWHVLLVHGQRRVKNYKCSHCKMRFPILKSLASHLAKCHRKLLKFKCVLCHLKFITRKELVRHKTLHKNIPIKKKISKLQNIQYKLFRCNFCMKMFRLQSNYETHSKFESCITFITSVRKNKTLGEFVLPKKDRSTCRYCEKSYAVQSLRKHIRRCHAEDEAFYNFSEMIQHIQTNSLNKINEEPVTVNGYSEINFDIKTEAVDIKEEPKELKLL